MSEPTPMEEQIAAILERAALDIRAVVGSSHPRLALLRDTSPVVERAVPDETMPKLLTPDDLAAVLQIDSRTLRRLRNAGEAPPSITIASVPRWRPEDVAHWLEQQASS